MPWMHLGADVIKIEPPETCDDARAVRGSARRLVGNFSGREHSRMEPTIIADRNWIIRESN